MRRSALHSVLAAVLVIPFQTPASWQVLSYKKIKPNAVSFANDGLTIAVDGSASPVVYPLSGVTKIYGIHVKGRRLGELKLPKGHEQGKSKADDFTLRVGVVLSGDKRLSRVQSWIAPDWIKRLYALAPSKAGIDHIEFYNLVEDPKLLGKERRHPKSELLLEHFVTQADANGEFTITQSFPNGLSVLAIWLAADGDDTGSKFSVTIRQLELKTQP